MILGAKESQRAWPHRLLFLVVLSLELQYVSRSFTKTPKTLEKSTNGLTSSLGKYFEKALTF